MNMSIKIITVMVAVVMLSMTAAAEDVYISGFLQGLYGGGLDSDNPTSSEMTAQETRLQMKLESFSDNAEFFGRLDFVYDGYNEAEYDFELREGYLKFRLGIISISKSDARF